MKRALLLPILALCAVGAHAQMYKSTGPDGRVIYSDTPPAQGARELNVKSSGVAAPELPYVLAQAVKANPVTLYTAANCAPCASGRALLVARGVPYTEKTVSSNEDVAALKTAGGDAQLPLLLVGRATQRGFEEGAWNGALSAAGYPAASMLPRIWRNPPPMAAAPRVEEKPAPAKAADTSAASRGQRPEPQPAAGNAPPGFRF